jgi:NTP pyrophosphatase (non-canonical NTP hydrolase)
MPKIIKEHHDMMIEKGFYSCPTCNGHGLLPIDINGELPSNPDRKCHICKGTGIDPNKNIGELLSLLVGELTGEALEAHRNNRFADWDQFIKEQDLTKKIPNKHYGDFIQIKNFEQCIKDTFEDEIADVFLRLFDLCGYLELDLEYINNDFMNVENVGRYFYESIKLLPSISKSKVMGIYDNFYSAMIQFCKYHNIPIEKHIMAKMEYNKTRPHKHGKEY